MIEIGVVRRRESSRAGEWRFPIGVRRRIRRELVFDEVDEQRVEPIRGASLEVAIDVLSVEVCDQRPRSVTV